MSEVQFRKALSDIFDARIAATIAATRAFRESFGQLIETRDPEIIDDQMLRDLLALEVARAEQEETDAERVTQWQ